MLIISSLPPIRPVIRSVSGFAGGEGLMSIFRAGYKGKGLVVDTVSVLSRKDSGPRVRRVLCDLIACVGSRDFTPQAVLNRRSVEDLVLGGRNGIVRAGTASVCENLS